MPGEPASSAPNTPVLSKNPAKRGFIRFSSWLALAVFLLITWLAWLSSINEMKEAQKTYFDFRVREAINHIEQRMRTYEQVLMGVQGLYEASASVTRNEFKGYVASLRLADNYPGIQGVGFSLIVPEAKKNQHLAAIRKEGFPEYSIRPEGQRDPYTSIIYLEPFADRNLRAFGYDMYSEPVRRAAMERARDTGNTAVSGKVRLVQESGRQEQAGFLMYLPVYRNDLPHDTLVQRRANIIGWAYAPFRMDDLMQGIHGEQAGDLDIEIHDGKEARNDSLMYDSDNNRTDGLPHEKALQTSTTIQIAGHVWTLNIQALSGFYSRVDKDRPMIIAVGGVVTSLLLTWLIWLLATGRERAILAAREMNRELIETEARFRLMADSAPVMIWLDGIDKRSVWLNKVWLEFTGRSLKQEIGYGWTEGLHPDDRQRVLDSYSDHFDRRQPFTVEYRLKRHDDIYRWLSVRGIPRFDSEGRFAGYIGSCIDISERKQAEQALLASEAFAKATIDAVSAHICVLDKTGKILAVNQAWRDSHEQNRSEQERSEYCLDANYLAICESAPGASSEQAAQMAAGIREVIEGKRLEFSIEYPCHCPSEQRWFITRVTRFSDDSGNVVVAHENITKRKLTEIALRTSEETFRTYFERSMVGMAITSPEKGWIKVNDALCESLGYPPDELNRMTWAELTYPDDLAPDEQQFNRLIRGELDNYAMDKRFIHKNGSLVYTRLAVSGVYKDDGSIDYILALVEDITEHKANETKLKLAASVFSHAREGIIICDADGTILEVNDTSLDITGYSREELVGQNPRVLQSGRHDPEFFAAMWRNLTIHGHWAGEIWNRRKNGALYAELITISAVRDTEGKTQNYVALFSDITPMKEQQRRIEHLAHHDALTGLPNRTLLADRLPQAMAQSRRHGLALAVLYLDLDGFKTVNDRHGHDTGDELLITVAQRMKEALRDGDTLARIGGDEFIAVLVDLERLDNCEPVLIRLLQAAANPVTVGQLILHVSASIGVTFYPQDEADADQLINHADQAMYRAKQSGKNRYHLFDAGQDEKVDTGSKATT